MLNSSVELAEKQHAGRKQCNGLPNMAVKDINELCEQQFKPNA